jgi:hypothetical protein
MGRRAEWKELFGSLGEALLELLSAERDALLGDLRRSGKTALFALLFFFLAACLVFWLLGVLTATLVAVLARWLPVWGAALVVTLVVAAAAAVLAWLGMRRWQRVEGPGTTFTRRWEDHRRWWREEALPAESARPGEPAGGDDDPTGG